MSLKPKTFRPRIFNDPGKALAAVADIYRSHTDFLRRSFCDYAAGRALGGKVRACYPYAKVSTKAARRSDTR